MIEIINIIILVVIFLGLVFILLDFLKHQDIVFLLFGQFALLIGFICYLISYYSGNESYLTAYNAFAVIVAPLLLFVTVYSFYDRLKSLENRTKKAMKK